MDKHTQGKLRLHTNYADVPTFTPHGHGGISVQCFGDDKDANARRLVACWNACEGIGTDEVEKIEVKRNMRVAATEYAALESDRDRLLAENARLREALQLIATSATGTDPAFRMSKVREVARAALSGA